MVSRFPCPDCDSPDSHSVTRRDFVKTVGVTVAAGSAAGMALPALAAGVKKKKQPQSERLVKKLYESFTPRSERATLLRMGSQR